MGELCFRLETACWIGVKLFPFFFFFFFFRFFFFFFFNFLLAGLLCSAKDLPVFERLRALYLAGRLHG